jgi:hypothetical protein
MPAFLALIPLKYWLYGAAAAAVIVGALTYRSHLIDQGWDRALEAVKVQDTTAKDAASKAQSTVDGCYASGGVWSVITGKCTLETAKP